MFREVSVIEIREVLPAWMAGSGLRVVAAQAGMDRKTARSYVTLRWRRGWIVTVVWISSPMS